MTGVRSGQIAELTALASLVLVGLSLFQWVAASSSSPGVSDRPLPAPAQRLAELAQRLQPLHRRMGQVQPGDWRESHPELGQTFRQFLADRPGIPCVNGLASGRWPATATPQRGWKNTANACGEPSRRRCMKPVTCWE